MDLMQYYQHLVMLASFQIKRQLLRLQRSFAFDNLPKLSFVRNSYFNFLDHEGCSEELNPITFN